MKRFISFFISLAFVLLSYAQQRGASQFNTDDFPNVSFVWNDYNPDVIQGNQVSLKEDDQLRSCAWRNITPSRSVEKSKSIVILCEDMRSHGEQSDLTFAMLRAFFSNGVQKNDRFNIIAFNRDKGNGDFMRSITRGFSNNISEITMQRPLLEDGSKTFVRYNQSVSIVRKVVRNRNYKSFQNRKVHEHTRHSINYVYVHSPVSHPQVCEMAQRKFTYLLSAASFLFEFFLKPRTIVYIFINAGILLWLCKLNSLINPAYSSFFC